MDKRKIITAYRKGFLSIQECARIMGIDSAQLAGMIDDPKWNEPVRTYPQSANN